MGDHQHSPRGKWVKWASLAFTAGSFITNLLRLFL